MQIPECSICTEQIVPVELMHFTPCAHIFHSLCIEQWKTQSSSKNGAYKCPICRYDIYPEEVVVEVPALNRSMGSNEPFESPRSSHVNMAYATTGNEKTFLKRFGFIGFFIFMAGVALAIVFGTIAATHN